MPSHILFANAPDVLSADRGKLPPTLADEIRKIYENAPIYSRRHPLTEKQLTWQTYEELPILSKREIIEKGHQSFFQDYAVIERGLTVGDYEYESTSGTTQGAMTVIMERGWWDEQTRRAYLANPRLAPFAGREYRKCILAPVACSSNLCPYEDQAFPQRYHRGTVYLNLSSDPFMFPESEWDRILIELQAVKPDILEGEPVYLSLLARAALHRRIKLPSIKVVILTYGKASLQHSRSIARAFPAPQVDLYGSTEAGYLLVGDAFMDNSRVVDENVFAELLPCGQGTDTYHLIVTTRRREAMPLLRYRTGDIVRKLPTGYRLLGREDSILHREDGTLISSIDIDTTIPENFSCWHYSLIQTAPSRWDFHYVSDNRAPEELPDRLSMVLGANARVNIFRRRMIQPAPSGKFTLFKPLRLPASHE